MSHYTNVKTKLKNKDMLVKALISCGFKSHMIETFDIPVHLRGFQGDERQQLAHIRIKGSGWKGENYVGGASNDLGFEQLEDGTYRFHVSRYDTGRYGKDFQQKLCQNYSVEVIKKTAQDLGQEFIAPVKQGQDLICKVKSYY